MREDGGGWGNGGERWRKGRKGWRRVAKDGENGGIMGVGWWRMGRMGEDGGGWGGCGLGFSLGGVRGVVFFQTFRFTFTLIGLRQQRKKQ